MTDERINTGYAALQTDSDDVPVQVSGIAIGEGDITRGGSGKETLWPRETLKEAAGELEGKPLALPNDHTTDNPSPQTAPEDIVGEVTWSGYKPGVGIVWEGELSDESLADKVENGYLDVSPQFSRDLARHTGEEAAYKGTKIRRWRDLALVAQGAAPSNEITVGGNPMKAEALHNHVADAKDGNVSDPPSENPDSEVSGAEALKEVAGVEFDGTAEGELDESEIPNDDYEEHYLYPADTKTDSSYPVVDAEGNLRRGNVDAAHQLGARGGVDEDEHRRKLMALAEEFDPMPEWADSEESMGAQVKDPALWEACSLSLPESLGADPAESGRDTQSDDGPNGGGAPSSVAATDSETTMTDELSDDEKAILQAAEGVDGAAEALNEYAATEGQATIVAQSDYEAMQDNVESVRGVMEDALCERSDLKESTVEALDFEALRAEFETEDGDLDAEALVQNPETGDPGTGEAEALSDETLAEARNLKQDIEALGDAAPEALKEDLAEMVDEDSYADAVEVL